MKWSININFSKQENQDSYIGGKPSLPPMYKIPKCKLCNNEEVFFFQITFPEGAIMAGKTLAVFSCVSCVNEDFLIPEMLKGNLRDADIPSGFLDNYQRNFSFEVFDSADLEIRENCTEIVKFKELLFGDSDVGDFGSLEGTPRWLIENEAPKTYANKDKMKFLLQIEQGINFSIHEGAPRQKELDLSGVQEDSPFDYYQLFLGNAIYLFVSESENSKIYAVTQVY